MEASLAAQRMRQQLSTLIAHSRVTLFTVDIERNISMFEGALAWDIKGKGTGDSGNQGRSDWFIGENVYEVFVRLVSGIPGEKLEFLEPIEDVFAGKVMKGTREHEIRKS